MNQIEIDQLIADALKKAYSFYQQRDYGTAEELYRQILRVSESNEALEMGSLTLSHNGKSSEAKVWMSKLSIDNYRLHNNLGLIHGSLNEHDEAISCFRRAIALRPDLSFLHTNLAIELKKTGDYDQAFSVLDQLLLSNSNCEHAYFNYASLVHETGDISKAIDLYSSALKINYDFPICHYNLSACWFLLEEYSKGWEEYEWRFRAFPHFEKIRSKYCGKYWSGESLKGKKLVLFMEQGIGDLIMTLRFAPPEAIIDCKEFDLIESEEVSECDYHCSLLSLPKIVGGMPNFRLKSNLERSTDWDKYGRKIGICWAGNPRHPNDRNRSCFLSNFKFLEKYGTLFSFQKDLRPHVYHDKTIDYVDEKIKMIDLSEHMSSFNKTAKMIEEMDLIVTVDTSIAHLGAALGKEVHVVLPFVPDWRWGMSGTKTKWYDTMTLHRQKKMGDWSSAFESVNKTLSSCVAQPERMTGNSARLLQELV